MYRLHFAMFALHFYIPFHNIAVRLIFKQVCIPVSRHTQGRHPSKQTPSRQTHPLYCTLYTTPLYTTIPLYHTPSIPHTPTYVHAGIHTLPSVDRMNDTCLWKHYLPRYAVGKISHAPHIVVDDVICNTRNRAKFRHKVACFYIFSMNDFWNDIVVNGSIWIQPVHPQSRPP